MSLEGADRCDDHSSRLVALISNVLSPTSFGALITRKMSTSCIFVGRDMSYWHRLYCPRSRIY